MNTFFFFFFFFFFKKKKKKKKKKIKEVEEMHKFRTTVSLTDQAGNITLVLTIYTGII